MGLMPEGPCLRLSEQALEEGAVWLMCEVKAAVAGGRAECWVPRHFERVQRPIQHLVRIRVLACRLHAVGGAGHAGQSQGWMVGSLRYRLTCSGHQGWEQVRSLLNKTWTMNLQACVMVQPDSGSGAARTLYNSNIAMSESIWYGYCCSNAAMLFGSYEACKDPQPEMSSAEDGAVTVR